MLRIRTLPLLAHAAAVIFLATCASMNQIAAEDYAIEAKRPTDRGQRVSVQLEIRGTLIFNVDEEQADEQRFEVDGEFAYIERQLRSQASTRYIRRYETARAHIDLGRGQSISELGDENRWLITDRRDNTEERRVRFLSATDGLTQKELELINIPANTVVWDRVLESGHMEIGATWNPDTQALADALAVDVIRESTIECTLVSVRDGIAEVQVKGTAAASVEDAQTELEIDARCQFDLQSGHSRDVQLTIQEARQISGSAPGFDAMTKLAMTIARPEPDVLPTSEITAQQLDKQRWSDYLRFVSPNGQMTLRHERRWRLIRNSDEVAVFRLIDGGILLGQVNLEPRSRLPSLDAFTLAAFQQEVAKKISGSGSVSATDQWKTDRGLDVMCVTAQGKDEEIDVTWRHYHIVQPDGQRVSAVVTFDSEVREQFDDAERRLLESLTIAPPAEAKLNNSTNR